jgi:ammonium transporter, Amt family
MPKIKPKTFKVERNKRVKKLRFWVLSIFTVFLTWAMTWSDSATAQNVAQQNFTDIGTIWLLVAAILVFSMNAGFAMLEAGFCRTENAINVLAKNLIVFCIAAVAFWLFGFQFMFGDTDNSVVGPLGLFLDVPFPSANGLNPSPSGFSNLGANWPGRSFTAVFFFQLAFAGIAASIVSGAVAERIKFWAFILFSFVMVGFIYPLTGHWIWGGGWLFADPIRFRDFAGSTVVHSVGGMAALVGAWLLQPRKGRFGYNPTTQDFPTEEAPDSFKAYDLGLATLGCFILWLGWFGFNGGSTTRLEYVPHVILTTLLAASLGGVAVILFSPFVTGQKVSLSSMINGILGGLVSITAASAYVDIGSALIIGALSGVLVLSGENFLKWLKIDDPVGAVPVHLFCGGWGTIAVGLFASTNSAEYQLEGYHRGTQILYQLLGWSAVVTVVAVLSLVAWIAIGLLLGYLDQTTQLAGKESGPEAVLNLHEKYGLLAGVVHLFQLGRQGIRVSLLKEEDGSDETIVP